MKPLALEVRMRIAVEWAYTFVIAYDRGESLEYLMACYHI